MNRRAPAKPPISHLAQRKRLGQCPTCGRTDVEVGGLPPGPFILQNHGPKFDDLTLCPGSNQQILIDKTSL